MATMFKQQETCKAAGCLAVALLWCAGAASTPARAAQRGAAAPAQVSQTGQGEQLSQAEVDAERGAFDRFLDAHPEIEGEVFRDPHQISDANYIHEHPELDAFLENHPAVKADPRAFISPRNWRFESRRDETDEFLSYFIPFSVFICMLLAVLWVLRLILENRRWNKSFRVHEEVHAKLIDRFASGQELTAYMESEAGRRLLEWSPPADDRRPFAASRILWSLTAGLTLGPAGAGLLVASARLRDAYEPLLVFGLLGVMIGAGFLVSAIASYVLSKHLGLLGGSAPGSAAAGQMHAGR